MHHLEQIVSMTKQNRDNNDLEGTLRIAMNKGSVQYYHCKKGAAEKGDYISKKNSELPRQLAQKAYDEKIIKYADTAARQIRRLLKKYADDGVAKIYMAEHPERQKLVTPVEPTRDQQLQNWFEIPFEGKGFNEMSPVISTNSGVRVRSKSEKIIADYLESLGIKYKYECPLNLKMYGIVYPDFTFFSTKTGKEIYWEHEGMMDNPEYARKAISKIELYEKNGIFPGENLILSFETSTSTISTELIRELVHRYLM